MCDLTNPIFTDNDKAREHLESIRWPNGPVCPHCGGVEQIKPLNGKGVRPGLYYCNDCEGQFTATVGTVFERSKVPLSKWVLAFHLVCASKKGMSAHQLHRMLGVTYKTAWFMCHRIREAMVPAASGPMGEGGGVVEADEAYWGNSNRSKAGKEQLKKNGRMNGQDKQKIVALVERDGNVRSFHVATVTGHSLKDVLRANIHPTANLMTDDYSGYRAIGREFASHQAVNHSAGEYSRGNAHTNTVEGFFSILKRGLNGTFHHVAPKHLGRYCTEFNFRYNTRTALGFTDTERAKLALKGVSGKRLTYRRTAGAQATAA